MTLCASKSKKKPAMNMANIKAIRIYRGEDQQTFWSRYGITQSGGSRYENGRNIPMPSRILVMMHLQDIITTQDIERVMRQIKKTATKEVE